MKLRGNLCGGERASKAPRVVFVVFPSVSLMQKWQVDFSLAGMSAVKRGSHYRGVTAGLKLLGSQNDSSCVLFLPAASFTFLGPRDAFLFSFFVLLSDRTTKSINPNFKCQGNGGNDLKLFAGPSLVLG